MGLSDFYVESWTVQKRVATLKAFCLLTSTVLPNFWRLVSVQQSRDTGEAKKTLEITPAEELSKPWNCMNPPKSEISQCQSQLKFLIPPDLSFLALRWVQGNSKRCCRAAVEPCLFSDRSLGTVPTSWSTLVPWLGSAAPSWLTRAAVATLCTPREQKEVASSFFSSVLVH